MVDQKVLDTEYLNIVFDHSHINSKLMVLLVFWFPVHLNDLDMLENIGNPICMGNADQALKDKMKVIIGDNNSDAISDFLISLANK